MVYGVKLAAGFDTRALECKLSRLWACVEAAFVLAAQQCPGERHRVDAAVEEGVERESLLAVGVGVSVYDEGIDGVWVGIADV